MANKKVKKVSLEDIQMEIIQIREAKDIYGVVLMHTETDTVETLKKINELKIQEELLTARLKEWTL